MGSIWLHQLDDWCREEGIPFREYPGWLTRSRSSGGFDALFGVVAHHTASSTSWQNDTAWEWLNAPTRPIGNVHLDRQGVFTLGVAGASNTNGRGDNPWVCSKGTIPIDPTTMGNRMAFAIEAANNGVGEVWPRVQMDSYLRFMNMLCRKLGLDPMRDVDTHQGWAGPRKVDAFGPASGYPTLGTKTWPTTPLRVLVRDAVHTPPPDPEPEPPTPVKPPIGSAHLLGAAVDALVIKYVPSGATAENGWWGYFSPNGGVTRYGVRGMDHCKILVQMGARDAVTGAKVTAENWAGVSATASTAVLDDKVGPNG